MYVIVFLHKSGSLMELLVRHGKWVTMGTGGVCELTSVSLVLLHFFQDGYGSFHFSLFMNLCSALLSFPLMCALLLSSIWPSIFTMPRERGRTKSPPPLVFLCSKAETPLQACTCFLDSSDSKESTIEDISHGLCGRGISRGTNYGST
jgi:hypothetical protein